MNESEKKFKTKQDALQYLRKNKASIKQDAKELVRKINSVEKEKK